MGDFTPGIMRRRGRLASVCILAVLCAGAAPASPGGGEPVARVDAACGLAVAFTDDGSRLLVAGADQARVFDASTFQPVGPAIWHGRDVPLIAASLSPDGRYVLTAAVDEARVWDASSGDRLHTLRHDAVVRSAAFSADGTKVLTAGDDGTARVWDASTGKQLLLFRCPQPVLGAYFSPAAKRVFTTRRETNERILTYVPWRGVGQLWDAATGAEVELGGAPHIEKPRPVAVNLPGGRSARPVAFRPDGRDVATAFASGIARYSTVTGSLTEYWDIGEVEGTCRTIEYSRDGRWIVAATGNGFVQVWDARGKHLACPKFGGGVTDARFSADGRRVATAGTGDATGVWDSRTGARVLTVPAGEGDEPTLVALSPDAARLAVSRKGAAETTVWAVPAGGDAVAEERAGKLPAYQEIKVLKGPSGKAVGFSGDGRRLVAAGAHSARVWDVRSGEPASGPLDHAEGIAHAALNRDGTRAFTAGGKSVRVWDVAGGKTLFAVDHAGAVRSGAFSPDGRRIATAANGEKVVRVRDATTGELVLSLEHPGATYFAAFTPDGANLFTLCTGGGDGQVSAGWAYVWDARTGGQLLRRRVDDWAHQDGDFWTTSAALSPDGKLAATCQFRDVVVWELDTGKTRVSMDTIDAGAGTMAMAFTADGTRLLTCDATSTNLWSTSRVELVFKLNVFGVRAAAFLPGGTHALLSAELFNTGVYDLSTGERVLAPSAGSPPNESPAFALSPDGQTIGVSGGGETVLWQAAGK
jgi:WD40 repeat protein